jgi:hypothetical protein
VPPAFFACPPPSKKGNSVFHRFGSRRCVKVCQQTYFFADLVSLSRHDDNPIVLLPARKELFVESAIVAHVERVNRYAVRRREDELSFVRLLVHADIENRHHVDPAMAEFIHNGMLRGVLVHVKPNLAHICARAEISSAARSCSGSA